jgi:hypothetical protein
MAPNKLKSGNFLFHKISKIGEGVINQREIERLAKEGYVIGKNVSIELEYCLDTYQRTGDNVKDITIMKKDGKYKKDYQKWKGDDIRKRNNLADVQRAEAEQRRKKEDQEKLDLEAKVRLEQKEKTKEKTTPTIESSDSSSSESSIDEDPKPIERKPTMDKLVDQKVTEHLQQLQREFQATQQIVLQAADKNIKEAT